MTPDWNEGTLARLAEVEMGQSPPSKTCNGTGQGLPLLNGPTEFGPYHPEPVQWTIAPKKVARTGDILFCVRGSTTGRMNWADQDYAIGRGVAAIRHKAGRDFQPFLRGVIDLGLPDLLAAATGSTFPNVSREQILSIPGVVPPPEAQHAIARILGALDNRIELNGQMNRTLEAMAQAIFKSWFVDFDPVVAKAAGRQPFAMDAETANLFPDRFAESELGPIPMGWRISNIGDETQVVGGSTPRTNDARFWEGGEICWITPRDLSRLANPIVLGTERRITDAGLTQISSGLLPAGTVLLSSRAPIGYLAIAAVPLAVNQGFIAMVCKGTLPTHFVFNWTLENIDEVLTRAGGTTFAEISKASFRPIPVLVSPERVLIAFESLVAPLYDRIEANMKESGLLAELRDTLIPKLLSGEIRVKHAEKVVGGTV